MLTIPWSLAKGGWGTPEIKPYGPLMLDPSASVLHYAQELFEGQKAYKDKQGRSRLFRPDLNMKRMRRGAERMAFPVSLCPSYSSIFDLAATALDLAATELTAWTMPASSRISTVKN